MCFASYYNVIDIISGWHDNKQFSLLTYSVSQKKGWFRKSLNCALFLSFMGLFIKLSLFHLNTIYMRRKMSGQTLLKASFKLRYSTFRKVNYSIKTLTFVHILEAITNLNRSNFGHFRKKAILNFLHYKILINQ